MSAQSASDSKATCRAPIQRGTALPPRPACVCEKKFRDAERWYDEVVTQFGGPYFAAEAMFWRDVSRYSRTHDHAMLKAAAEELRKSYPASPWAVKALPCL
jgi:hypothetical protein